MKHYLCIAMLLASAACGKITAKKVEMPQNSKTVVPAVNAAQSANAKRLPGVLVAIYAYQSEKHYEDVFKNVVDQQPLEFHVSCLPDAQSTVTKEMVFNQAAGFAYLGFSARTSLVREGANIKTGVEMLEAMSPTGMSFGTTLNGTTTNARYADMLSASYFVIFENRIDMPEAACGL